MKKIPAFLIGATCSLIIASLTLTALAAGGVVSFNQVGVSLFSKDQVKAGDSYVGQDGQYAPSSITYTDERGGLTNYLSIRQISEMLDADIFWNNNTGIVEIAPRPADGQPSVSVGGQVVIPGTPQQDYTSTTAGPFHLIETKTPAADASVAYLLKDSTFQSESDFEQLFHCTPDRGKYINITVTNNNVQSEVNLIVNLYRHKTVGSNELFPSFQVEPGKTVTKTVSVDETATELTSWLGLNVTYDVGGDYKIDTNISAIRFD